MGREDSREFRLDKTSIDDSAPDVNRIHSDQTLHHEKNGTAAPDSSREDVETGLAREKSEESSDGPPQPVGFWHKDLKQTRLAVLKEYWLILILLCTFILAVLALYWGSLYNADMNLNSFVVYIVNFETQSDAVVGPALVKFSEGIVAANKQLHLGYVTVPASTFSNDPLQVREAVYSNEAWAAFIVNPNATQMLRQAVETGNASYDPLGACQLIYQDARDQTSYDSYILPQLSQLQTEFTALVGQQWASQVLSNMSITRANLEKAPQAVSPAVGFSVFNLRPFYPSQTVPSVTVGLIYLIIVSFFAVSFFMPIHMKFASPEGHPPLRFWQLVTWRWLAAINSYFFLSLAYSLVSLAFQIPFSDATAPSTEVAMNPNPFGKATFVVYWTLNFLGMTALGMACENVAMVIGFPWTAMWLIFWVIINVTTSFYPIELTPAFYDWGYALPLHNIVEGSRTLLFDLHSRLGLNFGVLLAHAGVSSILFPFCSYFMRWKTMREKKKEQ